MFLTATNGLFLTPPRQRIGSTSRYAEVWKRQALRVFLSQPLGELSEPSADRGENSSPKNAHLHRLESDDELIVLTSDPYPVVRTCPSVQKRPAMRRCASHFLYQVLAGTMLFLCLTLLLSACGISAKEVQTRPSLSLSSELDAFLRAEVKAEQFSGAVLVARKGTILLSKGYGLANDDPVLANTPTTMFGLGPVTEEFTAMAILILQERGKLHIPDPICTYLSSCPVAWQPITISHLLTNSSGIPSNSAPGGITFMQLEREPLDFKPGTQFNFSSSGYVVLATLIEKVSGEAYGTFLQQNIFAPLQMTHTGYDFTQPHLPNLATGYNS